ncbi:MAG TPA: hypothetical protein PKH39_06995 [Woeseiaceae bacterium]|nr:hypothetical protein [Woeseiaceae bacterium]
MNGTNTLARWTDNLPERAEIFPHSLNLINDNVLLVELSADEIRAASFLDQRVLQQTSNGSWIAWRPIADIFNQAPAGNPVSFIFHVGHCGSTLLSRLLQLLDGTQSLREPLPLRTLAQEFADTGEGRSFLAHDSQLERLQVLSKMWSRGASHTVIKATSVCTDLLPAIHSVVPGSRFVFVFNRPETHIATLLAGENALQDLRGFAQIRLQRLRQATGIKLLLHQLNPGQLAALSWLSETVSATRSLEAHAGDILPLEFEAFIGKPAETLTTTASFLGIAADEGTIESAVQSDVLRTYSKAPEHEYNANTRAAILANSRSEFSKEIRAAMTWLGELSTESELIAASLEQFG